MTINIIIFNSALELTVNLGPKKLKHPVFINDKIRRMKKNAGELLLDIAIHYSGMSPKDRINRGRPDIVYQCMLQYHFSLINQQEKFSTRLFPAVRLFIHTIQDYVFEVIPKWRIPVSYVRFRGLIEKLLILKEIEKPHIQIEKQTINELVAKLRPEEIILWTELGNSVDITEYSRVPEKSIVWLIGGFQSGDVSKDVKDLASKHLKLVDNPLPAWKVLGTLLTNLELGSIYIKN